MQKIRKGFTLTELIVVIAIIGILTAIVVPSTIGYIKKAKISKYNQEASQMTSIINNYLINEPIESLMLNGELSAKKIEDALKSVDQRISLKPTDLFQDGYRWLAKMSGNKIILTHEKPNKISASGQFNLIENCIYSGYTLLDRTTDLLTEQANKFPEINVLTKCSNAVISNYTTDVTSAFNELTLSLSFLEQISLVDDAKLIFDYMMDTSFIKVDDKDINAAIVNYSNKEIKRIIFPEKNEKEYLIPKTTFEYLQGTTNVPCNVKKESVVEAIKEASPLANISYSTEDAVNYTLSVKNNSVSGGKISISDGEYTYKNNTIVYLGVYCELGFGYSLTGLPSSMKVKNGYLITMNQNYNVEVVFEGTKISLDIAAKTPNTSAYSFKNENNILTCELNDAMYKEFSLAIYGWYYNDILISRKAHPQIKIENNQLITDLATIDLNFTDIQNKLIITAQFGMLINANNIKLFSQKINNSELSSASNYFMLEEDIDCKNLVFEPIGQKLGFNGHFYGNGHVIKNYHYTNSNALNLYSGFFGMIGVDGVIENIVFENINISSPNKAGVVAGINLGFIKDIVVSGQINGSTINQDNLLSLIVGENRPTDIENTGIIQNIKLKGEK